MRSFREQRRQAGSSTGERGRKCEHYGRCTACEHEDGGLAGERAGRRGATSCTAPGARRWRTREGLCRGLHTQIPGPRSGRLRAGHRHCLHGRIGRPSWRDRRPPAPGPPNGRAAPPSRRRAAPPSRRRPCGGCGRSRRWSGPAAPCLGRRARGSASISSSCAGRDGVRGTSRRHAVVDCDALRSWW